MPTFDERFTTDSEIDAYTAEKKYLNDLAQRNPHQDMDFIKHLASVNQTLDYLEAKKRYLEISGR